MADITPGPEIRRSMAIRAIAPHPRGAVVDPSTTSADSQIGVASAHPELPNALMRMAWRNLLLGALIAGQVAGIVAARFESARYFCWAPYDEITQFEVTVTVAGRKLSAAEAQARYRLPDGTRDNRSHAHVIAVIAHYERTIGAADAAQVELNFRINGGPPRQWRWPRGAGTGGI